MIDIPEKVEVTIDNNKLIVKGEKGTVVKKFKPHDIQFEIKDNKIDVVSKNFALQKTFEAHLKNMIKGASQGFKKELKALYSHFPISLEVKGNQLIIKNFAGEKQPRIVKILDEVKVSVKGQEITVEGADLEKVSQTAANIIQRTRVKDKDPRIFQDGVYYKLE